jgi:polysaccharide export outer membrane protein
MSNVWTGLESIMVMRIVFLMLVATLSLAAEDLSLYVLGPRDQIRVNALHVKDLPIEPITIDADGSITLPLIGRVDANGLTAPKLASAISRLMKNFILEPDVTVTLVKRRNLPVSILGEVNKPGVHELQEPTRLMEILSLAGGTRDEASSKLIITRRIENGTLPLRGARTDSSGQFSIAEVDLEQLVKGSNPEANILIAPNDVLSIPRAELVYVIGEVKKPGGFVLRSHERVRVLQALAKAEGFTVTAGSKNARIMRVKDDKGEREEIPVNLQAMLNGSAEDVQMQPDDILFVPNNLPKSAALRGMEAAIQMATGVVIWRR